MKKIFAIALAVVMVLSMASAFAYSTCATWNPAWNCPTDDVYCGQGKVEVIPYVKVNTACGWEYQVSDCASAIRSGEVYFAVRLTVDAFPDAGWWSQAWIDFETDGLFLNETIGYAWTYSTAAEGRNGRDVYDFADLSIYDDVEWDGSDITNASWDGIDPLADEEKVYYLTPSTAIDALTMNNWVDSEAAGFDIENVVFTAVVDEAVACGENPEYSVCATLYSEYDGWTFAQPFVADRFHDNFFRVGDYVIGFNAMGGFDRKGNLVSGEFWVTDLTEAQYLAGANPDNWVIYTVVDGKTVDTNTFNCTAAFAAQVNRDFNMEACGLDTCITEENIQNNFGWDDEQESCFDWSTKGAAVVDTDCVVAIPKTGDASVLAWLF